MEINSEEDFYSYSKELENGVKAEIFFDRIAKEVALNLKYHYCSKYKIGENPDIINYLTLHADYERNSLINFDLSMKMISPKNLGKVRKYSLDISPNSKLYIEFPYENIENNWGLDKENIFCPNMETLNERTEKEGLLKVINLPFPVEEFLKPENGIYKYPFLDNGNNISYFEFPESYKNDKELIDFFNRFPKGVRKVN